MHPPPVTLLTQWGQVPLPRRHPAAAGEPRRSGEEVASGCVDRARPRPTQPRTGAVSVSPGEAPPLPAAPAWALAKEIPWQPEGAPSPEGRPHGEGGDGPKGPLGMGCIWGCSPPAPPLFQRKPQAPKSRIPSSAPSQGREARRGLLFICKGFCQKLRQETAKENLAKATTTKKGNRIFQKGSHIPSQTRQL